MPEISRFYGIVIAMFYNDHAPPHFHARYGHYEAQVRIDPTGVLEGELPKRATAMVLEWALAHRTELWRTGTCFAPRRRRERLTHSDKDIQCIHARHT